MMMKTATSSIPAWLIGYATLCNLWKMGHWNSHKLQNHCVHGSKAGPSVAIFGVGSCWSEIGTTPAEASGGREEPEVIVVRHDLTH